MTRLTLRAHLALAVALPLCGCTLIGLGVGNEIDKSAPPLHKSVARGELETLKIGEQIEIQLWDGRRLQGSYQGLEWARPGEYAPLYEAARRALEPEVSLPALGPGARVVVTSGESATGEFHGVGPGFVRFVERGRQETSIQTHRLVTLSDALGRSVSGGTLDELLAERRLPTLTRLRIEAPPGTRVVDHADVAGVSRLVRPTSARTAGALIGLAADVAVVALAYYAVSEAASSCPLVFSFDGREFVLDAEPLGGAFYRAAERTDVVRLERIVEAGGRYRLRIRNEMQEIDHLDAVALRVVDHPEGTEIVPDAAGRLHAVRVSHAPAAGRVLPSEGPSQAYSSGRVTAASAVGQRAMSVVAPVVAPVAALLAAADGDAWVSDGRGRDPSRASDLRDGIELEYPRPPGASSALLVARVGATDFGSRLLADALALHGQDLGLFYARLEAQPAMHQAFERAREREVLPTVRLFDGKTWRVAGYLRDLPVLVRRQQAVPLDLRGLDSGTEGGSLRLRIDGAPGVFSIDRAVVSYDSQRVSLESGQTAEPGGALEPRLVVEHRVPPDHATDDVGRDVLDRLRRADGRRHSLRPHLDAVTLAFPAPERRAGLSRTVLVEATGYYNVIVRPQGAPRPDVFRRLLEEPDAVARFALERLRDWAPLPLVTRSGTSNEQ